MSGRLLVTQITPDQTGSANKMKTLLLGAVTLIALYGRADAQQYPPLGPGLDTIGGQQHGWRAHRSCESPIYG
jgi:hypothetical protein